MKELINVTFRRPSDEGILPVWDEHSKVLILGSITAIDGMNKGFYYASYRNQLWELLDYCMGGNVYSNLKNELKVNYDNFSSNKITKEEFIFNKGKIKEKFSKALLDNNIAICDVFTECYFNNNSSLDQDIILNNSNYPFKTSKDIIENILNNSRIKTIIVNSKFVEKVFLKMGIEGNYDVKYVMSPSPRRGVIEKKKKSWEEAFSLVSNKKCK